MKFYLKQGFVPTYVCAKSQDDTCKKKKRYKNNCAKIRPKNRRTLRPNNFTSIYSINLIFFLMIDEMMVINLFSLLFPI